VINKYKVATHFDLNIADTAFSFARKTAEIAAEAAVDGVYVIRTSLAGLDFASSEEPVGDIRLR
jgi:hypothetical protein